MKCETVKVVADNDQGFIIINKSDLTDEHKVYAPEKKAKKAKPKGEADDHND